jgi:hypothetical protein
MLIWRIAGTTPDALTPATADHRVGAARGAGIDRATTITLNCDASGYLAMTHRLVSGV